MAIPDWKQTGKKEWVTKDGVKKLFIDSTNRPVIEDIRTGEIKYLSRKTMNSPEEARKLAYIYRKKFPWGKKRKPVRF